MRKITNSILLLIPGLSFYHGSYLIYAEEYILGILGVCLILTSCGVAFSLIGFHNSHSDMRYSKGKLDSSKEIFELSMKRKFTDGKKSESCR